MRRARPRLPRPARSGRARGPLRSAAPDLPLRRRVFSPARRVPRRRCFEVPHSSSERAGRRARRAARRLEEQRLELELLRAQVAEQRAKAEQLGVRQADLREMRALVGKTLAPLQHEREKTRLLLRNFAPQLADAVDEEFDLG